MPATGMETLEIHWGHLSVDQNLDTRTAGHFRSKVSQMFHENQVPNRLHVLFPLVGYDDYVE